MIQVTSYIINKIDPLVTQRRFHPFQYSRNTICAKRRLRGHSLKENIDHHFQQIGNYIQWKYSFGCQSARFSIGVLHIDQSDSDAFGLTTTSAPPCPHNEFFKIQTFTFGTQKEWKFHVRKAWNNIVPCNQKCVSGAQ